jgi:hypothetical protein
MDDTSILYKHATLTEAQQLILSINCMGLCYFYRLIYYKIKTRLLELPLLFPF